MAACVNFLKFLDSFSSKPVAQKIFSNLVSSTSFHYKEEGEKEGPGWIFSEELLDCLNKYDEFVYFPKNFGKRLI